jgi:hypothetical protein
MSWNYRWRASPAVSQLEQAIDQLRMDNIQLRRQLTTKTNLANGLKLALAERHTKIDALTAKLEQARAENRKLDEENDHLVESVYRWKD